MMKTLESGLIKGAKLHTCKYYDIESLCQKIVHDYCSLNKENNEQFQNLASNYHLFRPYFDFVVCELGYKVLNPELQANTILVGKDNHMYLLDEMENPISKGFYAGKSDDKTLDLYPMTLDSSSFHDCLIDGEGNHILPKDMFGHVHILNQIANMIFISNQKVCEEYLRVNMDLGSFISRYYPLIRFQADKQGRMILTRCVYRKSNLTEVQNAFMNDLLANRYTYPSFLNDLDLIDPYPAIDLSKTLSYEENSRKL